MTLSSASRGFKGKRDMSSKAASEALQKIRRVEWDLHGGYGVGVVQGKNVTPALNAPTNVLAILMGKDS